MPARKSGLGKGLGALIPLEDAAREPPGEAEAQPGLLMLSLDAVTPNPLQPRLEIREEELADLSNSIREHGLVQPLVVARTAEGYQLIAGERRWRAARMAGLVQVPAIVKDVAPRDMLELALVENVQRADLNPLEEALAYRQLAEEFGLTQEEIARRVGKSRVAITNTMRLLRAAEPVRAAVLRGEISEGHARALLGLERPEAQTAALGTILKGALNVRQTEALVQRLLGARTERPEPSEPLPDVAALEDEFRTALGTRVNLKRSGNSGRLVIYFYSDEELEAIYGRIVRSE